jgi:hypothetical protein
MFRSTLSRPGTRQVLSHRGFLASISASATRATQHDSRILECLFPPVLWNASRYISMAERDVLGVKIPAAE